MQVRATGTEAYESVVSCCLVRGRKPKGFSSQGLKIPVAADKACSESSWRDRQEASGMLSCSFQKKGIGAKQQKEKVSLSKANSNKSHPQSPSEDQIAYSNDRFRQSRQQRHEIVPKTAVSSIKKIKQKFLVEKREKLMRSKFQQNEQNFNQRFNDKCLQRTKATYLPSTHRSNNTTYIEQKQQKYFYSPQEVNKSHFFTQKQDESRLNKQYQKLGGEVLNEVHQDATYYSPHVYFGESAPALNIKYFKAENKDYVRSHPRKSEAESEEKEMKITENQFKHSLVQKRLQLEKYKSDYMENRNGIPQSRQRFLSPSYLGNACSPANKVSSTQKLAKKKSEQSNLSYYIETPKNSASSNGNNLKFRIPTTNSVFDSGHKATILSKESQGKSGENVGRVEESIIMIDYFNPSSRLKEQLEEDLKRRSLQN